MAAIVIRKFGGMAPSANQKSMSDVMAQYAKNINLRFADFRPMPVAAEIDTAAPGQTLYKFDSTDTWITKPGDVSFVRGPIPNDATERTYYTGDGAPKVTDITLAVRALGVPAPAAAPEVAVNIVPQYSREDAAAAEAESLAQMTQIVNDNVVRVHVGLPPGELAGVFSPSEYPWLWDFRIAGAMQGGAFVPATPSHQNLIDPRFGFFLQEEGGVVWGKVPIVMYGSVLQFDAGLAADLGALADPSNPGNPLLTAEQREAIQKQFGDLLAQANANRDAQIEKMRNLKTEWLALANDPHALVESDRAAAAKFYSRASVMAAVASAKAEAVQDIGRMLYQLSQENV